MRRLIRTVTLAAVAVLTLAACGQTTDVPTVPATPSQDATQSRYLLDGKPVTSDPSTGFRLTYSSADGYQNAIGNNGPERSLDDLLPWPRRMEPYVVNTTTDLTETERGLTVGQRAIERTRMAVDAGQPVNNLPSKLLLMHKPEGTTPTDNSIDDNAKSIGTETFSTAYIETDGVSKTVVIVTAHPETADRSGKPAGQFYLDRGITGYKAAFRSALPGENEVKHIVWQAALLQADCTSEQMDRDRYSPGCAAIARGDNQSYAGNDNVILVAPLSILQSRDNFLGNDNRPHSNNWLSFLAPVSRDGVHMAVALFDSGIPNNPYGFDPPVSREFGKIQRTGLLVGGNDVADWPAFSVLDK